jgi:hypothetical protein
MVFLKTALMSLVNVHSHLQTLQSQIYVIIQMYWKINDTLSVIFLFIWHTVDLKTFMHLFSTIYLDCKIFHLLGQYSLLHWNISDLDHALKYPLAELTHHIVQCKLYTTDCVRVLMMFLCRVGTAHRMRRQHLRSILLDWIVNLEERPYKCELLRAMSHVTSCESSKV